MILFWTGALALTIFLYVTLDGFDLGVGMLLPFVPHGRRRNEMLAAVAPIWDGNETWLVLNATILFGIFPLTYATLLSAFYLPLIFMLAALIFRGVSFEFRGTSHRTRVLWDKGFIAGSYIATFLQGMAVGALVRGLPMDGFRYVGGAFGWFSPFALLCGIGLCIGYALMGAGWLAFKSSGSVQDFAFRTLPPLLVATLGFLAVAFGAAIVMALPIMHRWLEQPALFLFPAIGVGACATMVVAIRRRAELVPFLCALAIFAAAFGTLAMSFYPYMIPFAITTTQAAAPVASQAFLFWGAGLFVLPLTLAYTLAVYFIFKGKVRLEQLTY